MGKRDSSSKIELKKKILISENTRNALMILKGRLNLIPYDSVIKFLIDDYYYHNNKWSRNGTKKR